MMVARGEGHWETGERGEEIQKYKFVVAKLPQIYKVQHRENSQ